MKKTLFGLFAALLLITSCASSRSAYKLSGEWSVVNLCGQTIAPSDETPFLGFDLNQNVLYGFTGCNRLTGSLDAANLLKGKADFGALGCTRMLCPDNKYEQPFLEALGKVEGAAFSEDNLLLLKDNKGNTLITLKKR